MDIFGILNGRQNPSFSRKKDEPNAGGLHDGAMVSILGLSQLAVVSRVDLFLDKRGSD